MNKPKYSGKRPTMWYQRAEGKQYDILNADRIRIIFPNGKIEWCSLSEFTAERLKVLDQPIHFFSTTPCYLRYYGVEKPTNHQEALTVMRRFDRQEGYPRAQFLGEL